VGSPISLGRAGYWRGRALEAMGQRTQAQAAYRAAATHQTSFYGQLAAERAGLAMSPELAGGERYPGWRSAPFARSGVLEAAQLFAGAGERTLAEIFLLHLAREAGAEAQAQLAGLAFDLGEPHLALRIAKEAAGDGAIFPEAYFPLTDLARKRHPVPTELVLAIARRESEFDPAAISGAGARGLMQLLPSTAEEVAGKLNMRFSTSALTADPAYNATLGAAYLADLESSFGTNPVLLAAAYNAGPSRARQWIAERGDPRGMRTDQVIDWIEAIPFTETRNYVMRVTEALAVYRARLAGKAVPITLSQDLTRR
jgi:Soluble lytic murein transglycosylase and related regulatory proteins (some contain LysM/invasin domains)